MTALFILLLGCLVSFILTAILLYEFDKNKNLLSLAILIVATMLSWCTIILFMGIIFNDVLED